MLKVLKVKKSIDLLNLIKPIISFLFCVRYYILVHTCPSFGINHKVYSKKIKSID